MQNERWLGKQMMQGQDMGMGMPMDKDTEVVQLLHDQQKPQF